MERVQRKAIKMMKGMEGLIYEERLKKPKNPHKTKNPKKTPTEPEPRNDFREHDNRQQEFERWNPPT